MTLSDFERSILILFLWQQKQLHSYSLNQLLAIATCLRNRVLKGWHGSAWLSVVNEELSKLTSTVTLPDPTDPIFSKLLWKIDDLFAGAIKTEQNPVTLKQEDSTGNALYFCNVGQPINQKFRMDIIQQPEAHPKVASLESLWLFA